jgi:hypothetical protein
MTRADGHETHFADDTNSRRLSRAVTREAPGAEMLGNLTATPRCHRSVSLQRPRSSTLATARQTVFLAGALALGGLTCACIDRNNVHRIPAMHGLLADAVTGKPIQGMKVTRWLLRQSGFGPGGSDDALIEGSVVSVTTDASGRFEFPSWRGYLRGIDRLEWCAFKSGYMPATGWFRHVGNDSGLPGYNGLDDDPWVKARFTEVSDGLAMDLQVFPPTLDGVTFRAFDGHLGKWVSYVPKPGEQDPWAEYFHRLRVMTMDRLLRKEEAVTEAAEYLANHEVTDGMLDSLSDMVCSMEAGHDRKVMVQRIISFCQTHGAASACQDVGPRYVIEVLSREGATR